MDKLTAIKIKNLDGSYSNPIAISALAQNVLYGDGVYSVKDILDSLDARIDNVTAVGTDGQLTAIRVGADNETYATARAAIVANDIKNRELVLVKDTQPTETWNKLWLDTSDVEEQRVISTDDMANIITAYYDEEADYAIGDYVIYEDATTGVGKLYKCNTAISGGEIWTAGHWTEVKVVNEVTDLKSAFEYVTDTEIVDISLAGYIATNGSTVDINTVSPNETYIHGVFDASAGDVYIIKNATGGSTPRLICFIDSSGNSLYVSPELPYLKENLVSIAPSNTSKVVINCNKDAGHTIIKGKTTKLVIEETDNRITEVDSKAQKALAVKTNISDISGNEIVSIESDGCIYTSGSTVDITNVYSNEVYSYAVLDCSAGDQFYIVDMTGGGSPRAWCFIDSNGNSLAVADERPYRKTNTLITAPATSSKLVLNCVKNEPHRVYKNKLIKDILSETIDDVESLYYKTTHINENLYDYTGNIEYEFVSDGYISTGGNGVDITSVTSNTSYKHLIIDCNPGDSFTITGTGGATPRLWCFIGTPSPSNVYDVKSRSDSNVNANNLVITAPIETVKLVINVNIDLGEYKVIKNSRLQDRVTSIESELNGFKSVSVPSITNERWLSYNNNANTDVTNCYTDYVPVIPGRRVILSGIDVNSSRAVCAYDLEKSFNHVIITGSSTTTYEFTVPSDVHFIRITGKVNVPPTVMQSSPNVDDIHNFYSSANIIIPAALRKNTINRKIVTLIDDDADNESACAGLADLCDDIGMKCTFAAVAKLIDGHQSHADFLLDLQSRGFHIANHTYDHSRWYDDTEAGDMFTLAECEEDLLKSFKVFADYGFVDSAKYFVYTGNSEDREGLPELVKKWCEVAATTTKGNNTIDSSARFKLRRINIDASAHNLAYYQQQLEDYEVDGDNWIIYYTHCKMVGGQYDATLTQGVLENAINEGYTPMTYNEAWNYRKSTYMIQEMFAL